MGRLIEFGGPNLREDQVTWFETRLAPEVNEKTGKTELVGGNMVQARHGDVFDSAEMGKLASGESYADYHVRTGRAHWAADEPKPEVPAEELTPPAREED